MIFQIVAIIVGLFWIYAENTKKRDDMNELFQECLRLTRKIGGIGAGDDTEKSD